MMAKWKLCHFRSNALYPSENGVPRGLYIRHYGLVLYVILLCTKVSKTNIAYSDTGKNWYGYSRYNVKTMSMPDIVQNIIVPRMSKDPEAQHYSKFVVRRHEEIWNAMSDSNPFIQRDDWIMWYMASGLGCSYPVVYAVMAALWVPPEEIME
jgi:hypothetical protein